METDIFTNEQRQFYKSNYEEILHISHIKINLFSSLDNKENFLKNKKAVK